MIQKVCQNIILSLKIFYFRNRYRDFEKKISECKNDIFVSI